jgi:FkbM family methyltransferase|tara:strand:- start:288 stop:881 length:594 start_codon:yes stop_codon:yes gene_type:complete
MDEFQRWFADDGDNTHLLNYELTKSSIVFDVGGYKGDFAHDIYSKYGCKVYVFEPVVSFYNFIKDRFSDQEDIKVFNFGLADTDTVTSISLNGDESSVFKEGKISEEITLKGITEVMEDLSIDKVDLMKVNIEGGEYPLLSHIVATDLADKFDNIQVQFHTFADPDGMRRADLQGKLKETHTSLFDYPFVWEGWTLK